MTKWTEAKPTNELRWHETRLLSIAPGGGLGNVTRRVLQQKWLVTKGGTGKVEYFEEWREIPTEEDE
jgi:hypothetical protein